MLNMLVDDCLVGIDKWAGIGSLQLRQTCRSVRTSLSELPIHLEILKVCYKPTDRDKYVLLDLLRQVEASRLPIVFDVINTIAELNPHRVLPFDIAINSFFIDIAAGIPPDTPNSLRPMESPERLPEMKRLDVPKDLIFKHGINPGFLENMYNHVWKNAFIIACECNQLEIARFLSTVDDTGIRYKAGGVNNAYACVVDQIQSNKDNWGDAPEEEGVEMPDFDAKYADMLAFLKDDLCFNTRPPRCDSPAVEPADSSDFDSEEDEASDMSSEEDD